MVRMRLALALFLDPESWLDAGDAEVARYESGHRRLAAMMGRQADTYSEKDVSDALRYLLPTRLTAPDARPLLKVQWPPPQQVEL